MWQPEYCMNIVWILYEYCMSLEPMCAVIVATTTGMPPVATTAVRLWRCWQPQLLFYWCQCWGQISQAPGSPGSGPASAQPRTPCASSWLSTPLGCPRGHDHWGWWLFNYYNKWVSTLDSGFYAPKSISDLRLSVVLRSHLLLFFFGRKNMLKKKAVSPRSHPTS